jgi:hypothetical protein
MAGGKDDDSGMVNRGSARQSAMILLHLPPVASRLKVGTTNMHARALDTARRKGRHSNMHRRSRAADVHDLLTVCARPVSVW